MKLKNIWACAVLIVLVQLNVHGQSNGLLNRDFWRSQPSLKEVKKKVKEGNSPTEANSNMFDVLVYAILENTSVKVVDYLMGQGNDLNRITHDARSYLHWAAYRGNIEVMKYLLDKGIRTDILDDGGNTALMFAAATGQKNKEVYELCIANGIDIKTDRDRRGRSALLAHAGRLESFDMVDYFLSKGLDIHHKDNNGNGIFHYAAATRDLNILKKLVDDYKVDYSANKKTGENAFRYAVNRNFGSEESTAMPVFEYLESLGLNPALENTRNQNVLHVLAYRTNNLDYFKYFIDRGANPAMIDEEGNNPLINAAARGSKDKIAFLANFSHDINHQNKEGQSAMTRAFKYNTMEVIELMASKGASIDLIDQQGHNFGFHLVDATGTRSIGLFDKKMAFLVKHGFDPKANQKDNSTLLHAAIGKKNIDLLKKIMALGVDVNAKDDNGQTILHHAAMQAENEDLLKFLLSKGANKSILTEFDESAYDLAKENELLKASKVDIEFLNPVGQ